MSGPVVAIVGATGAVGREMLAVLGQRAFPLGRIRVFASERSVGSRLPSRWGELVVEPLHEGSLRGTDLALFSAGSAIARRLGPAAAADGALVIDNSSAFRMDPGVPLVVPEVNPEALAPRRGAGARGGLIANPNCSTIIMVVAVTPLRRAFGVERIVVSTYQAVSGAGAQGIRELEEQARAWAHDGPAPAPSVFHEPCAFNLFSHNSAVDLETGLNLEERKMIDETRKIWGDASARISATCVRVPVRRAHSESINVTLARPASEADVRAALRAAPGLEIVDDRAGNRFPTPLKADGRDSILVGRLRRDPSQPDGRGYDLFVSGDQLRKGAALNAVQIAEHLF
ncbi:MAG: aspartate-semialdehyde dehydrogenase [Phycisphaerae bacterium]|nr:aspartate-semialdehyde dehydrogenase [Phycisphaerae bacterium]